MTDFSKIRFDDAVVKSIRISPTTVEVDYVDWAEKLNTLVFINAISCFSLSPHEKVLSHGEVEFDGQYLAECCEGAEEDLVTNFAVFNFVSVWSEHKILRIVAEEVRRI